MFQRAISARLIVSILCLLFAGQASSDIVSNFDTDTEGWLVGGPVGPDANQGDLDYFGSGGDPTGFIRAEDTACCGQTNGLHLYAPAEFLGNLTSFNNGTISFSARLFGGDWDELAVWGRFTLTDGVQSVEADFAPGVPTLGQWTSYSAPFSAATFGVGEGTWLGLIDDVTGLRIVADDDGGLGEIVGYDNITIASVPLPASLPLLVGALSILVGARAHRRINFAVF